MTPLQVAKAECATSSMSGEEYLAREYCEPTAYWHCLHELEPSGTGRCSYGVRENLSSTIFNKSL